MPVVDRVLTFMSIDDLHAQASKLASLNLVLLLTIAVHQVTTGRWIQALIIVACAVVGLRESYRRPATLVALSVLLVRHVATFPLISNHSYLELILLTLFVWIDASRSGERELLLQGLRWVTVIVFFYSGVQKAWYGEYFDGRYLAFLAATSERTRMAFELLLPPEELARLVDYGTQVGSGPFRIQSPLLPGDWPCPSVC